MVNISSRYGEVSLNMSMMSIESYSGAIYKGISEIKYRGIILNMI